MIKANQVNEDGLTKLLKTTLADFIDSLTDNETLEEELGQAVDLEFNDASERIQEAVKEEVMEMLPEILADIADKLRQEVGDY